MDTLQFSYDDIQTLKAVGLEEKVRTLLTVVEDLYQKNSALKSENKNLKLTIAKLTKQSRSPSFSSKKYTSEVVKETAKQHTWKKSVKKEKIEIDETRELPSVPVCTCGCAQFINIRTRKKIIQEIKLKRNNICYLKKDKKCYSCGKVYTGSIPLTIKGLSFGQELRTFISYLKFKCRLTEPLLHTFLKDLGISISKGAISNILLGNGKKLIPAYTHLRTWGIKNAPYLQTDATGHKFRSPRSGKVMNHYMHFLGNDKLSLFKITPRYNSKVIDKLLTTRGKRRPLLSDDGGANGARLIMTAKQLCWIHEIRHFLKLTPLLDIHKHVLQKIVAQLYAFYHRACSYKVTPTRDAKQMLQQQFDAIVNQQTGYKALDQRLQLTKRKRERLLLFLKFPYLPINNNQAERDLRPAVIIRKISHGTKSIAGNQSLERHLSVIHTAQKLGLNTLQTLTGLISNTLSPFVLTSGATYAGVPTQ